MDLDRPFQVVTPTLDGVVLQVLAGHLNEPLPVADIRREAGVGSEFGLRKVLKRLVAQGVVDELPQPYGFAAGYRLNRFHLAFGAVTALARQRELLVERLAEAVSEIRGLHHAELTGDPEPELVLVADPEASARVFWRHSVEDVQERVRLWTGLRVAVRTLTPQEWEREHPDH